MRVREICVSKAKADVLDRREKADMTDKENEFHFLIVIDLR
jgi:hypothetical protein